MARSGPASRPTSTRAAGAASRLALVDAAIETLQADGFAGASARAIAGRAGCAQGLVFYHFGSVADLLLAALDAVSDRRLARYRALTADVATPADLVAAATQIFSEDLASGDVTVLVEMIGGASTTPGLGPEVAARLVPWRAFAEEAIAAGLAGSPLRSLVPVDAAGYAVTALYLGMELLSHLDGDRADATALFGHLAGLASLLQGPASS
jgi:AcrR family transcriptional regulator